MDSDHTRRQALSHEEIEKLATALEDVIFESGNCIKGSELRKILEREYGLSPRTNEAQRESEKTRK